MKIIVLVFVTLIAESFGSDEKNSVHFKIHVPEIVKHHLHTKTVFIHLHEMKPHEEEKEKEEHHIEDWTSYNSYNYNDGVEENHAGGYHRNKQKQVIMPYDDYLPIRDDDYQPYGPPYPDELSDNVPVDEPPVEGNPLGYFGPPIDPEEITDPRVPPATQYEIHEDVEEEKPNDVENMYYEHGYRRGMNSETGHVIHKDLNDFYDKEHKHADFNKGGYEDNRYNKYNKHGYFGNYDKEMNAEQRAAKKRKRTRGSL